MRSLRAAVVAAVITFPVALAVACAAPAQGGGQFARAAQVIAAEFTSAPAGLRTVGVTESSASFLWNAVPGAASYHITGRSVRGHVVFISQTVVVGEGTGLHAAAGGLSPCTRYEWRVRATGGRWSRWMKFRTLSQPLGAGCMRREMGLAA